MQAKHRGETRIARSELFYNVVENPGSKKCAPKFFSSGKIQFFPFVKASKKKLREFALISEPIFGKSTKGWGEVFASFCIQIGPEKKKQKQVTTRLAKKRPSA